MKEEIPSIKFKQTNNKNFGFEIVPINKIANIKQPGEHNPQKPHRLKFYNLLFFTKGNGRHFIDFKWYSVKKNTLVYLSKEAVHAFDFSTNLEGYCIIFTEAFFASCFPNFTFDFVLRLFNSQLFSPILYIPKESNFVKYLNLTLKELKTQQTFNQIHIIKSLLTILISKAENIKQNTGKNLINCSKLDVFQNYKLLIQRHHSENRNANFYASKLGITYKHLNTICKELINKTAKNIIDDFIILQAKRKLINTSIKSSQLGYELGFEDPTNFTKYFKNQTGLSPKSFKKKQATD